MNKNRLASGFNRFEFKSGFKDFRWRGMVTEGDPSSNPANRPRLIVNGRLRGGGIIPRPGIREFRAAEAGTGWSFGIIKDFQMTRPRRLWALFDGCPGISSSAGFAVCYLDCEQNPMFQRVVYYSTLTTSLCIAPYNGCLYIGADNKLRKIEVLSQPFGQEAITLSGSSQDVEVYDFGSPITCMQEFDGKLFIGINAGAGASKIYTYDGVTIREDKTSINAPTCFGVYHAPSTGEDAIFVGFGSATNKISYRPAGDSPGTWTDVLPAAGTIDCLQMRECFDCLWIAGGTTGLWKYNGTTLAASLTTANCDFRALNVDANTLYYGYTDLGGGGAADDKGKIGKTTNGTVFTAYGELEAYTGMRCLETYAGYLVVGGTYHLTGSFWYADADLAATWPWTRIIPNAQFCGELAQMVVF